VLAGTPGGGYAPGMHYALLLGLLVCGAADVYRWVDEQGQVVYSDVPRPGAEQLRIDVPAPATPAAASQQTSGVEQQAPAQPFRYDTFEILSPAPEEVLWNIEGQLNVLLRIRPTLQRGHSATLYLDDQPAATLSPGNTSATLSEVYRGAHSLRAEIRDAAGDRLAQTPPLSFTVRQTSIANPVNPVNPPPVPSPR